MQCAKATSDSPDNPSSFSILWPAVFPTLRISSRFHKSRPDRLINLITAMAAIPAEEAHEPLVWSHCPRE